MQFIEFVLWRNLNDKLINNVMSILGSLLLVIQPIASLTMLKNIDLRNKTILIYSIPAFGYFFYNINNQNIYTVLSKKTGHLKWNWIPNELFGYLFYLFFLYFALFINRYYIGIILSSILFAIFYYYYYTDGTAGSLWCWSVNIVMLYYLIKLLFIHI